MNSIRSTLSHRVRNQVKEHLIHPPDIVSALQADPVDRKVINRYIGFDEEMKKFKFAGRFVLGDDAVEDREFEAMFTNQYLPNVLHVFFAYMYSSNTVFRFLLSC